MEQIKIRGARETKARGVRVEYLPKGLPYPSTVLSHTHTHRYTHTHRGSCNMSISWNPYTDGDTGLSY